MSKNKSHVELKDAIHTSNNSLATPFKDIVIFCVLIFIVSRYFFYLEYSFLMNVVVHNGKSLLDNMWLWDSAHYANIAINGYMDHYELGGNYVWLPLYPIILKIVSFNGYFDIKPVSILLNQILLLASFVLIFKYLLRIGLSKESSKFYITLLAFAPTNIYFFAGLTEVIFLFITVLSFYLLEEEKIWPAVLVASLLSGLKITGLSFAIAFLYSRYKKQQINKQTVLQICIMGIPLLCYMIYLQIHVGDFLAFIHAQKAPGFARPGFDFTGDYIDQISSMYNRATAYDFSAFLLSTFVVTAILWYRKYYKEAIFNLCVMAPVFISGGLWNSFRFGFCLFTAYLAVTVISPKTSVTKLVILIISTAMTMICMLYWLSGSWYFA